MAEVRTARANVDIVGMGSIHTLMNGRSWRTFRFEFLFVFYVLRILTLFYHVSELAKPRDSMTARTVPFILLVHWCLGQESSYHPLRPRTALPCKSQPQLSTFPQPLSMASPASQPLPSKSSSLLQGFGRGTISHRLKRARAPVRHCKV